MENCQTQSKPRYLTEVDFLKFVAIVGMVIVHIFENWTGLDEAYPYPSSALEIFIQFLGGPVCAPLFMLACGIGVIYTRNHRPVDYMHRGLILLVTAYILSFLRAYAIAAAAGQTGDLLLLTLLNVDILHLAGISFILIGILRALRCNKWHVLILAIVMFAISNYVGVLPETGLTGYVVGLFFFTPCSDVCFPLFEWFLYIAVGVFLGSCLRDYSDHVRLYKVLFALGAVLFLVVTVGTIVTGNSVVDFFALCDNMFYMQSPAAFAWIIGIVFMCMSAAYFALSKYSTPACDRFFHFYGKNLNRIYIMQWIIIGNMVAVLYALDASVSFAMSIPLGILLLAGISLLVPIYNKGTSLLQGKVAEDTGTF